MLLPRFQTNNRLPFAARTLSLFLSLSLILILFVHTFSTAQAHGGAAHLPSTLPACTARMLTCELVPELVILAGEVPIEERHCVDGMGVARQCEEVAPFSFMPLNGNIEKSIVGPPLDINAIGQTACANGMADMFPCSNIDLQSFLPLDEIGGGSGGNDLWGWTDPDTGKEYAIMGRTNGTAFVDVTDPANPVYLGNLPTHSFSSSWRDVKVYQNHAYVVADLSRNHGMQIFDLTQLRSVASPPVEFAETAHYDDFGDAHNVFINEKSGFAYAVGTDTCSNGLHMIDLSTPTAPSFAGCYADTGQIFNTGCLSGYTDGYAHDTQCVIYNGPDLEHNDKEICFSANEDTVTIVDVSDKKAPITLSRTAQPDSAYVHQGWLTEDQRYFVQDDELDEVCGEHPSRTYIWDMIDLDNPDLIGNHTGVLNSPDHNLYIRGRYAYQANYTSGLRILDISDVANANFVEKAFFDTYPSDDDANFRSAWSVYPYFDSGNVIVSTITEGLFVLRPQLEPDFSIVPTDNVVSVCAAQSRSTQLELTALTGYTGTIALTTQGVPQNASVAPASNAISFAENGTKQIDVTLDFASVGAGRYPLTLSATDGSLSRSTALAIDVVDAAPVATALEDIHDMGIGAVMLNWQPSANADSYVVEVAADADFAQVVDAATVKETSYTIAAPLDPRIEYFWRVRANNLCGAGANSAVGNIQLQRQYLPLTAQ